MLPNKNMLQNMLLLKNLVTFHLGHKGLQLKSRGWDRDEFFFIYTY